LNLHLPASLIPALAGDTKDTKRLHPKAASFSAIIRSSINVIHTGDEYGILCITSLAKPDLAPRPLPHHAYLHVGYRRVLSVERSFEPIFQKGHP